MVKHVIIRFAVIVILVFAIQNCSADANNREAPSITGMIRVVGNQPLTNVILSTSDKNARDRDYLITGPLREELRRDFQGKVVTLEGTVCTSSSPQFAKCFKPKKITVD